MGKQIKRKCCKASVIGFCLMTNIVTLTMVQHYHPTLGTSGMKIKFRKAISNSND